MLEDKMLQISLGISVFIHSLILVQLPQFKPSLDKPLDKIEVTYQKPQETVQPSKAALSKEDIALLKKEALEQKQAPPAAREAPPQFPKDFFTKKQLEIKKEPLEVAVSKKVSLPMSGIDMPKNAAYINYYQRLREEIRHSAYHNYSRLDEGEVYLSFVLLSNGQLQDVKIIEDKTNANAYLKEVALKSIKAAAPFPGFPPALNYDQLSFNIIISFEVGS